MIECRLRESARDQGRGAMHSVRCRFRYDVGGIEHVGTIATRSTPDPEIYAEMRRWVATHGRGTVQPIHYDPAAPQTVSLGEFGGSIDPPRFDQSLIASAGFAGGGALLLLIARWCSRRRARVADAGASRLPS